jgi:iron complex outermembrane receptor protein
MIEHSSLSGADSAPRLMLNWHLTPGQTLRFGSTAGNRPPSMFEKAANIRYVVNGTLLQETYVARGQVQPEHFRASEIGYLGDLPALAGSIDLRVFRERIDSMVGIAPYALPANTKLYPPQTAIDFVNMPSFVIRGAEYQLKVKLASATRLLLSQSLLRNDGANVDIASAIPRRASSLLLIQRFAGGAELSLGHYRTGQMSWQGVQKLVPATQRTDIRLGMPFRVGSSRCEAAVTVQNIGQPYSDFLPTYQFQRQAFASLTVQF